MSTQVSKAPNINKIVIEKSQYNDLDRINISEQNVNTVSLNFDTTHKN